MKFTLSWLKRHLDTTAGVEQISDRLTMLGLEVESVDDPAARVVGFITGHVLEAGKHPNADRLQLCKVSIGRETLQVVCGAPNARAGLKVVVATPGVVIPVTGEALKKGNVRGVESQAMMCSWRELQLGEDHSGIIELPSDTPVGEPLTKVLSFDPVFDVSITPNRADCLGVRGIARDLAAAGLGKLKPLSVEPVKSAFKSPIGVSLDFTPETASACPLFAGRLIRGVRNGESPAWLKDWLTGVGLRPISALVDITNYFTIDLNRPLHVFDAHKLSGNIHARLAKPGETLAALNGKTYVLDETMTVIADDAGPQGLGGVIGGEPTGVSASTTDVFLEAALFDPMRTATTGRKLAVDSDARYRFERGIDPAFVISGMELATRMIIELCGGEASEPVIVGQVPEDARRIQFRPHRVAQLGGVEVAEDQMVRILEGLGSELRKRKDGHYLVVPPSWRADITAEHDLVEEVIRVHGYEAIPTLQMPRPAIARPVLTAQQRQAGWVRRGLAARGLVETVTWSFLPSSLAELFGGGRPELRLANPISSDLDAMRPSVLANLVAAAGRNADRGLKDVNLFELGPQFTSDKPEGQRLVAGGIRAGRNAPRHWAQALRPVDAFDAKADALAAIAAAGGPADGVQVVAEAPGWYHPGRSGSLKLGTKVIAVFGEIHPRVLSALDIKGPVVGFEVFLDAVPLPKAKATKAKSLLKVSPFQAIERDFAFVVDSDVTAEAVVRAAKGADKALITDVAVFDLYEGPHVGEGKKSLAIQVTLQPIEKTPTDAEIEAIAGKVVDAVGKATGGMLRG